MSAAASPFSIDVRRSSDGATELVLHGEFDVAAAPDLRAALRSVGPDDVLSVSMDDVSFCDAATVGILVEARDRRDAGIVIVDASATVARLASILDLPWLGGHASRTNPSRADHAPMPD